MRMRTLLAAGGVAITSLLATGPAAGAQQPNVAQIALASLDDNGGKPTDRNFYDFDILANAAVALGLGDALANTQGITVFAPNDRAFQLLVADLQRKPFWRVSEADAWAALQGIAGTPDGAQLLTNVVTYHVVPQEIFSRDALRVRPGTELPTLNGATIKVIPVRIFGSAILSDKDRNDIDPFLIPGKLDIDASNGVVHGISAVLRPIDL